MPDWSYRTLFRPVLFQFSSRLARDITLQAMGSLSRLPWGSFIIRTLGHMESYPILETKQRELLLKYPIGLSGGLDIHGIAQKALAQFGFGFIEIGPVTLQKVACDLPIRRDLEREAIVYPISYENDGLEELTTRLKRKQDHKLPLMFRLRHMQYRSPEQALADQRLLIEKLAPFASGYYIDALDDAWSLDEKIDYLASVLQMVRSTFSTKLMFIYIPLDYPLEKLHYLMERLDLSHWDGIVIGDMIRMENGFTVGRDGKSFSTEKARYIREQYQGKLTIIASGGIHQPQDALDLLQAGADYLQLHSGLVYSGPGLPKRINEAIIYERIRSTESPTVSAFWKSWGWMCLLGLAMMFGGIIAWLIAAVSVVLPYDETFLGMNKAMLRLSNNHLLPFMSHDRITLAGTMISIGILYFQLAKYGLRKGLHWSKTALLASGIVGFSSFFLYLGHGYFDPLHAFVAAALLPMFFLSMRERADLPSRNQPNLVNDRTWLLAQWGQLMFVILGFALAIGSLSISFIGITNIFVPTDLAYLGTTHDMLAHVNPHLLPLIAHDRAGFGGALFADAIAILTTALWGVNQGERWLWWTFLAGGLPGFIAVFSVHLEIGYTDFWHLLPAYFALIVFVLGLLMLYPYLVINRSTLRAPKLVNEPI